MGILSCGNLMKYLYRLYCFAILSLFHKTFKIYLAYFKENYRTKSHFMSEEWVNPSSDIKILVIKCIPSAHSAVLPIPKDQINNYNYK